MSKYLKIAAIVASVIVAAPAHAGGLFGPGGLFKGTIGNAIHKHVQKPLLTPVVRGVTIVGGGVVSGLAGGAVGQPHLGAVIGTGLGHAVNDVAAGKR